MPEKKTIERAREDAREGKSASTQAGEFVREEIEHVREGKHGARSAKQAIAIGLSKAGGGEVSCLHPRRALRYRREPAGRRHATIPRDRTERRSLLPRDRGRRSKR